MNAIEAWAVDLSSSPPVLTPAGRLPTSWWPGGLTVLPGGALAVVTLRGLGSGPSTTPESIVAVANGIAYDAARDRIYVTGKLWPKLFEISVPAGGR